MFQEILPMDIRINEIRKECLCFPEAASVPLGTEAKCSFFRHQIVHLYLCAIATMCVIVIYTVSNQSRARIPSITVAQRSAPLVHSTNFSAAGLEARPVYVPAAARHGTPLVPRFRYKSLCTSPGYESKATRLWFVVFRSPRGPAVGSAATFPIGVLLPQPMNHAGREAAPSEVSNHKCKTCILRAIFDG